MVPKPVYGEKDDDAEKDNNESCTFSNWREFNIHDDDCYGDDDDDDDGDSKNNGSVKKENGKGDGKGVEEDTAYLFRLFDEEDDDDTYEDIFYEYPMPILTSMTMTGDENNNDHDNDNDSDSNSDSDNKNADAAKCTKIVTIRHHSAYPNSTGLAVWRSAEILARYLCVCEQQQQQQQLLQQKVGVKRDSREDKTTDFFVQVQNKKVLELGAGAGKLFE